MLEAYHAKLASMSVVGQEHAAMSRRQIKDKLDEAKERKQTAKSPEEAKKWAKKEKSSASKLRARNIVSPLSATCDYVLGAGRSDRKKPIHFGDSGVLPCALYLGTTAATVGISLVGSVGGYVLGLAAAQPGKGAVAGASIAGGTASVVLGTACWGLTQAAAVPGMLIKATANGVGLGVAKLTPTKVAPSA